MTKRSKYKSLDLPEEKECIWSDKKRPFFGLPLSFTRYTLYEELLIIDRGILFHRQDEIRLYRVIDLKMVRGPIQRFFGTGNVILLTGDAATPRFVLQDVLQPERLLRKLSDLAEIERKKARVGMLESIGPLDGF